MFFIWAESLLDSNLYRFVRASAPRHTHRHRKYTWEHDVELIRNRKIKRGKSLKKKIDSIFLSLLIRSFVADMDGVNWIRQTKKLAILPDGALRTSCGVLWLWWLERTRTLVQRWVGGRRAPKSIHSRSVHIVQFTKLPRHCISTHIHTHERQTSYREHMKSY